MAARASCTEATRDSRGTLRDHRWPRIAAIVVGIAWGHASLASAFWALEAAGRAGPALAYHPSVRVLEWTLLLPLATSMAVVHSSGTPLAAMADRGMPVASLALPALFGCALTTATSMLARGTVARRILRLGLAATLAVMCLAGASAAHAVAAERAAEVVFLRMVAGDTAPWETPAARSAARTLVERYPDSQWASEAWRVVATDAELRGALPDALSAWGAFAACFGDTPAPGRALASFRAARLLEQGGPADLVAGHYHAARSVIARTDGSAQAWIATESAEGLERLFRHAGHYAIASYWAARTCTNEHHRSDDQ